MSKYLDSYAYQPPANTIEALDSAGYTVNTYTQNSRVRVTMTTCDSADTIISDILSTGRVWSLADVESLTITETKRTIIRRKVRA